MDPRKLERKIAALLSDSEKNLRMAEKILFDAKKAAEARHDKQLLEYVLQQLCHLYVTTGETVKAEQVYVLREKFFPKPYVRLDRAFFYFECLRDFEKAVRILGPITTNRVCRSDFQTYYSALNLIGRAYLRLGRKKKAAKVLGKLVALLEERPQRPLFGFETAFAREMAANHLSIRQSREYLALVTQPRS